MNQLLISSQANPADLKGRRVLVVGLGESGLAMAKWLHQQQAQISFVDTRAEPPGVQALLSAVPDAEWRCQGEVLEADVINRCLAEVDLLALSPGVAFDHPLIKAAKSQGLDVWSEIDCFAVARAAHCPNSKVIAITGANGKTTTTALAAHLLDRFLQRQPLGGLAVEVGDQVARPHAGPVQHGGDLVVLAVVILVERDDQQAAVGLGPGHELLHGWVVTNVLVAVGDHCPASVPALVTNDVNLGSQKRVCRANNRADV